LESYLKTVDVSIQEFYKDVREAQHESPDPYLATFIDCLLASADYDSFYKVMAREGAKSLARKQATASIVPIAESKSEGKNDDDFVSSKKGGDDDEDFRDYKSTPSKYK
jgi:hypothetical protein